MKPMGCTLTPAPVPPAKDGSSAACLAHLYSPPPATKPKATREMGMTVEPSAVAMASPTTVLTSTMSRMFSMVVVMRFSMGCLSMRMPPVAFANAPKGRKHNMPHAQGDYARRLAAQAPLLKPWPHAQHDARARGCAHSAQERLQKAHGERRGGGVGKAHFALRAQFLHAHALEQAAAHGDEKE